VTERTIVFDIRANHDTGVARYGISVLAGACQNASDHGLRLTVVTRPGGSKQALRASRGMAEIVELDGDIGFIRRSARLRELLAHLEPDLYFTTHYTVDRQCPVPYSFTIHDLHRLHSPELSYTDAAFVARFGADELELVAHELEQLSDYDDGPESGKDLFSRYFAALNHYQITKAERIVSVSEATSRDITLRLGVPNDRIDLVPCAVDTNLFRPRDDQEVALVRARYELDDPYLIFVGLAHPNKRFGWLADNLASGRDHFPAGARLVAVGGHAEQIPGIHQHLTNLCATDFVTFTGRVSDDELAALYTGAAAWVTASLSEGNNLPPLEMLACGGQVIATDIPPLRERLDSHAHFYAIHDDIELVRLAKSALNGGLAIRGSDFTVPSWKVAGQLLVDSWLRTVDGG
jgi:glycosyltransferase involved in cell wall biosynthesis